MTAIAESGRTEADENGVCVTSLITFATGRPEGKQRDGLFTDITHPRPNPDISTKLRGAPPP